MSCKEYQGKGQPKTATELAYAGVISYNKKNLERELQNESQQQKRPERKGEGNKYILLYTQIKLHYWLCWIISQKV